MKNKLVRTLACVLSISFVLLGTSSCTPAGSVSAPEETVDINSFNRISYDASEEYESALDKYNKGCEAAPMIRDDKTLGDKKIALIIQGTSDRQLVEQALELLDKYKFKAGFAVTAMDAAEDDEMLKLISEKGHEVIVNGLNGSLNMEQMSDEDLIYDLTASRKVFTTLMDLPPARLMLNSTYYTDSICRAVTASGYTTIVTPSPGSYLNGKSFANTEKAQEYVTKLTPGKIVVYKLAGYIDAVELEPKTEFKKPALDIQATTDAQEGAEEVDQTITTLSWLLQALSSESYVSTGLDKFKAMSSKEYVEFLLADNNSLKADVYESIETMENIVGLSFAGLPEDVETAEELRTALTNSEAKATFFVSADDIEKCWDSANMLAEAGFSFATRGKSAMDLSGKDVYTDYDEISLGVRSLQTILSLKPKYYMPSGKMDDNALKACAAAGLSVVDPVKPMKAEKGKINCFYADDQNFLQEVKDFLRDAQRASLQVVDVTGVIEGLDMIPEIDKELIAKLREENNGKLSEKKDFIYTSEKAMSMTFYGVSNKVVVNDILAILKKWGYKGTFFVTSDEMHECRELIRSIIDAGHEVGLAYIDRVKDDEDPFVKAAESILGAQEYAKWRYDYDFNLVFQPYGDLKDETKEAVSACGCTMAGYEFSMVQSQYVDETDIKFFSSLSSKITTHRGSIAYFNMNYFTADKDLEDESEGTLCGKLVSRFISSKIRSLTYTDTYGNVQPSTSYKVKTLSSLAHSSYIYSPRKASNIISDDKIVMGSMASAEQQNSYMAARYVGNPDVTYLPGFTDKDILSFDTTGKTGQGKVLFLTFDDWGDEKDINELLYVLDKYNVKANFFVRTNNVKNNPNLLRAIAVSGHMLGSHTDNHFVGWHESKNEDGTYQFESITDEEAIELRADIIKSYKTMSRYCSDVVVDGKPALSTIYRPPTLGVCRLAMYQIYDVGFSYIVSGNFSTADYAANSLDDLLNQLRNGRKHWYGMEKITDGTIIIMHMSANATYTSEALDIMIPEWLAQGYTFARLDDYLH
ncbi:MAG: polysaccharide deacetylase family protein [Butyrivibrio sp.]|uniref:polysaccharide deacetylase family protein n=1 Tax=Butyrivibrio sp. TaxID=28121 RepID=UPI0025C11FCF|nr:polysaccharide deacetylase family protein [Butyrivibrio sp.]MBQ6587519.1 polysaccharide deacetylase family protein [Butyrivibrio sp.]